MWYACDVCVWCDLDDGRYHTVHGLSDHKEAMHVVLPGHTGSHEGEDGHYVVEHTTLQRREIEIMEGGHPMMEGCGGDSP